MKEIPFFQTPCSCSCNTHINTKPVYYDGAVSILCSLHPAQFLFAQPCKRTHLEIPVSCYSFALSLYIFCMCNPQGLILAICLLQIHHLKLSPQLSQCRRSFLFFSAKELISDIFFFFFWCHFWPFLFLSVCFLLSLSLPVLRLWASYILSWEMCVFTYTYPHALLSCSHPL